jgi:hypothetical protein
MGNTVTRFSNGVTNVGDTSPRAGLRMPDPTLYHTYFNDFDQYVAADWTVTETQAGATQALTSGDGGWLALVNSAANNDLNAIQLNPASFSFTSGKKAFFQARLKVDSASLAAFVVGLQVVDATPLDVTDGVYFLKAAGAATIDAIVRKNATTGSNSASAIASVADNTFVTLGMYYDGDSKVYYSVNETVLGSLSATSAYLPDTITTVSVAVANGSAVARTLTLDYVFAAFER